MSDDDDDEGADAATVLGNIAYDVQRGMQDIVADYLEEVSGPLARRKWNVLFEILDGSYVAMRETILAVEGLSQGGAPLAELYQRAMEIHGGVHAAGFDLTQVPPCEKDDDAPSVGFFLDSSRGIYMGRDLARMVANREQWRGVSDEDWDVLEAGPGANEDSGYDDTWASVIDNAVILGLNGNHFLWQNENGDLFTVPEGSEWDEENDEWRVPDPTVDSACMFGRFLAACAMGLVDGAYKGRVGSARNQWQRYDWFENHEVFDLAVYEKSIAGFRVFALRFDRQNATVTWEGNSEGIPW